MSRYGPVLFDFGGPAGLDFGGPAGGGASRTLTVLRNLSSYVRFRRRGGAGTSGGGGPSPHSSRGCAPPPQKSPGAVPHRPRKSGEPPAAPRHASARNQKPRHLRSCARSRCPAAPPAACDPWPRTSHNEARGSRASNPAAAAERSQPHGAHREPDINGLIPGKPSMGLKSPARTQVSVIIRERGPGWVRGGPGRRRAGQERFPVKTASGTGEVPGQNGEMERRGSEDGGAGVSAGKRGARRG